MDKAPFIFASVMPLDLKGFLARRRVSVPTTLTQKTLGIYIMYIFVRNEVSHKDNVIILYGHQMALCYYS
jgi:hypothetical protein